MPRPAALAVTKQEHTAGHTGRAHLILMYAQKSMDEASSVVVAPEKIEMPTSDIDSYRR